MRRVLRSAGRPFLLPLILLGSALDAQVGVVVRDETRIAAASGGFDGVLDPVDRFGEGLAGLGDLDGDGVADLAVGAPSDDGPGVNRGAVHVLFLRADGGVRESVELGEGSGGFPFALDDGACFGGSLAALGDVDGDGTPDLAVGARDQDGPGQSRGVVFVLFLRPDGTVRAASALGEGQGGFAGALDDFDNFGHGLAALGDLDGDGTPELAVGATGDDDAGGNAGAVTVLFLDPAGTVRQQQKLTAGVGGFVGPQGAGSGFGEALAGLDDVDGDGVRDLAVGAWGDDAAGTSAGAVWLLLLAPDGTVRSEQRITRGEGGFDGDVAQNDAFGRSVGALGDLDGDGVPDLVVGATGDDDGGSRSGACYVLFLGRDAQVRRANKISAEAGFFGGTLAAADGFGWDVALVGDLDGDGDPELAIGAPQDDEGGYDTGAVWLLFLETGPEFGLGDTGSAGEVGTAAGLSQRNGAGVNPVAWSSTVLPRIGTTWAGTVDVTSLGSSGFTLAGYYARPLAGVFVPAGEVLVDPSSGPLLSTAAFAFGGSATHSAAVPAESALAGETITVQVLMSVGSTDALTNALDLTLGF